jgi:hypothetical protein
MQKFCKITQRGSDAAQRGILVIQHKRDVRAIIQFTIFLYVTSNLKVQ